MTVTTLLIVLVVWEWTASILAVTDRSLILRQIDVWAHRSDFEKMALERIKQAVFTKQGLVDSLLHLVTLEVEGDSPKGRLFFRGLSQNTNFLAAMESLRVQRAKRPLGRGAIRRALADRMGEVRAPRLETPAQRVEKVGTSVQRLSWRVEKDGEVWFRRHPWSLARRSLPWLGLTVLVSFLGFVGYGQWPRGGWTVAAVTLAAALIPLGRIGWEFWDWADDRLCIKGDKIIMVHRRPLWLGEIRQEGNLDQVEQVGVRKDGLAALMFDFGTVTISLGASEPLIFEQASHPEWVQNEIFQRRTQITQNRDKQAAQTRLDEVSEILDTWDQAKKAGYFEQREKTREKEQP